MLIEIKKVTTDHKLYPFVEELLLSAFPEQERRDNQFQRENTDTKENFHSCIITLSERPIGMISLWNLGEFIYIEHFALAQHERNKGYGEKVLKHITQSVEVPIILEVEMPDDETSKRRIGFYERCGFVLHTNPYIQPPYRAKDEPLPMYLMTYGKLDMEKKYQQIKERIYQEVYHWKE